MKNKLPNDARRDLPPWPVILTPLMLALISAWLVFFLGWEPWKALSVVSLASFGIIVVLLVALMVLTGSENRAELWQLVWQTCRDDIDLLLKYFRVRK